MALFYSELILDINKFQTKQDKFSLVELYELNVIIMKQTAHKET